MKKVLVLRSSILGDASHSGQLADFYTEEATKKGYQITQRDLAVDPVPILDQELANTIRAGMVVTAKQREALTLSNNLIAELNAQDILLITAPMYNFHIPVQLKSYFDFIARSGHSFRYTESGVEGLIKAKEAVVISTRDGVYKGITDDLLTPYLRLFLDFIGITDIKFILVEGLHVQANVTKAMSDAKKHILQLLNKQCNTTDKTAI